MWVNSTGHKDAKICLIGEAPGVEEERIGFPFVGSAGRLLEGLLTKVGTTKARCYVTNVVKERPRNNDFSVLYEDASRRYPTRELLAWHELLKRELSEVKSNIIVPLGNEAFYAVTGHKGVMDRRGSVYVIDGRKIMPTIHPAAILRQWDFHTLVQFDLKRAVQESRTPHYTYKPPLLHIRPTYSEVIDELTRLASSAYVSFDIETAGELLTAIGFSDKINYGFCIPFFKSGVESYWNTDEELQIMKHIKALLECNVKKIAQNAQFDMTFLKFYYNIDVKNLWYDTMCMHSLVYAELPKGLDTLCSIYTRHPYYKDMRHAGRFGDILWKYNAMDAAITYECAIAIAEELEDMSMTKFYRTNVNPLIYPLGEMQVRGVKVDLPNRARAKAELTAQLADIKQRLSTNVGYDFNPLSPKQVADLLYNKLGFKPHISRSTGKVTTNIEAIERLSARHTSPLFNLILDYKKTSKLLGNWIDAPIDKDGRIRTSYVIGGTTTGRLASRKSLFGTGCLLPEAQVLTPTGWLRLDELGKYAEVMQWNIDGTMQFYKAKVWKFPFEGIMLKSNSDFHKNVYTPEHRIPVASHHSGPITTSIDKHIAVRPAVDAFRLKAFFLPISGNYGGNVNFPLIRILAMIQADGSIEGRGVRFGFKKQRKVERFLWLLDKANMEYTEQADKRDGYRRFYIRASSKLDDIIELLGEHKLFDSYLLLFDNVTLKAFIDELGYWDGHRRGKSSMYFTTVEQNAGVVMTIAHLCGYSASIRVCHNKYWGTQPIYAKPLWTVAIKPRAYAFVQAHHTTPFPYEGDVYCVTTQTGFFLTRYKDRISVTGNTNLQNLPPGWARRLLIPDEGKVFIEGDLSQAEARLVAWLSEDERLIEVFKKSSDIHRQNASWIFRTSFDSVTQDQRTMAKRLVHASNYGIGARAFSYHAKIQEKEAKALLERYFITFPRIRSWQAGIRAELGNSRMLTTPLGRKRLFFGRWGDELHKTGYAFIPQATVGDLLNIILLDTWRAFATTQEDMQLVLQVHDSIVVQAPIHRVERALQILSDSFRISLTVNRRSFTIPAEFKIGPNYNDLKKIKYVD